MARGTMGQPRRPQCTRRTFAPSRRHIPATRAPESSARRSFLLELGALAGSLLLLGGGSAGAGQTPPSRDKKKRQDKPGPKGGTKKRKDKGTGKGKEQPRPLPGIAPQPEARIDESTEEFAQPDEPRPKKKDRKKDKKKDKKKDRKRPLPHPPGGPPLPHARIDKVQKQ